MPSKKKNSEKTTENFEEALKRLEQIVSQLESGDLSLEKTISHYEEGISLLRRCRAALSDVENRIKIIEENEDGTPITKDTSTSKLDFISVDKNLEIQTSSSDVACDNEDLPDNLPPTNRGEQFLL